MKVGDTVYIVEKSYSYLRHIKGSVEKVGRKYFYANGIKFDIKTNKYEDHNNGMTRAICYFDLNDYYNEMLNQRVVTMVNKIFDNWDERRKIPLDKYKQIFDVLELKLPTIEELGIKFSERRYKGR